MKAEIGSSGERSLLQSNASEHRLGTMAVQSIITIDEQDEDEDSNLNGLNSLENTSVIEQKNRQTNRATQG